MPLPGYGGNTVQSNPSSGTGQDLVGGPPVSTEGITPNYNPDDIVYTSAEMLNQGDTAEGTLVPPLQNGQYRIPRPTGLKATSTKLYTNWYNTSWTFRRQITISHTLATAVFSNFTIPISVAASDIASNTQSLAQDILFTASDGVTKLNHEVESYNSSTGALVAWVMIPSISNVTDTTIYMYFGNPGAPAQQNPTGTWDANYQGVFHLNATSKNTISGNTASSGTGSNITGQLDGAISFASQDFLYTGTELSSLDNSDKTISFWVFRTSASGLVIGKFATPNGWEFGYTSSGIEVRTSGSLISVGGSSIPASVWTQISIVWVHSTFTASMYVNGAFVASQAITSENASGTAVAQIADPAATAGLDEIEASNTQRSAAWIATTYNFQAAPINNQNMGPSTAVNGNNFTLSWNDIDPSLANVSGYRIYYQNSLSANQNQVQIATATMSPCVVTIPVISNGNNVITFWCQPFLSSGLTLPLSACPTCTFTVGSTSAGSVFYATAVDLLSGHTFAFQIPAAAQVGHGLTTEGIVVQDLATGAYSIIQPAFIGNYNAANNPLSSHGGGASGGNVVAYDGTGSGGINGLGDVIIMRAIGTGAGQLQIVNGGNSFYITAGTGTPSNTTTPVAWVPVTRNGAAGFIPFYQ